MNDKYIYLPLKIFLSFIVFTEIFYVIGPIQYDTKVPFLLFTFLILMNVCFFYGYMAGTKHEVSNGISLSIESPDVINIVKPFIIYSFFFSFYVLYVELGSVSISGITNRVSASVVDYNAAYHGELQSNSYGFLYSTLYICFSFVYYAAIPLGVYYFKRLSITYKSLVVFIIVCQLLISIATGQRQDITNFFIGCLLIFITREKNTTSDNISTVFRYLLIIVMVSGLVYFFISSSVGRSGIDDVNYLSSIYNVKPYYRNILPIEIWYPISSIHFYLCDSYYNLSCIFYHLLYSRSDEYIFTFGFGNSWALINLFKKYLDIDLMSHTYQWLLFTKEGIIPGQQWHTIYPWIANDVTFLGCPFVVYYIGKWFATIWKEYLSKNNFYSIVLVYFFSICVFWFYGNNQVNSFYLWAFWPIVFLYRMNYKHQ